MKKTPEIRFPEFSGKQENGEWRGENGEWVEKRLGEVCKFYKGRGISKSDIVNNEELRMENEEFYKCIHYGELFTKYNEVIKKIFSSTKISNGFIGYKNDLLFPASDVTPQGLAKCSSLQIDNILLGGDIIVLRPQKNVDSIFLSYQINSEHIKKKILTLVTGTTIKHIYPKDLKSLKIHIPPTLDEQKKIAEFLSSVDEKIEIVVKKLKELKKYKKGLLQKLLNVKKDEPELRFKGFSGKWIEKRLGEIVNNKGGKALEKYVTSSGQYKFISIGNYSEDGKYIDNGQRIILNNDTKQKLLNKNDLVMILNDKTSSGKIIGSTILIDEDNKYIYNQRSERLICKKKEINPKFLWFILNSPIFRKKIFAISQGGTQIYVNFSSVKQLKIHIPPTLAEQEKIASFLSSIDEKIELNEKRLKALKNYKQGLLQKMFV